MGAKLLKRVAVTRLLKTVWTVLTIYMASTSNNDDEFIHQIAIKLSRDLNLVNPNDLLAQRVRDIAKTNTVDGFIAGTLRSMLALYWPPN